MNFTHNETSEDLYHAPIRNPHVSSQSLLGDIELRTPHTRPSIRNPHVSSRFLLGEIELRPPHPLPSIQPTPRHHHLFLLDPPPKIPRKLRRRVRHIDLPIARRGPVLKIDQAPLITIGVFQNVVRRLESADGVRPLLPRALLAAVRDQVDAASVQGCEPEGQRGCEGERVREVGALGEPEEEAEEGRGTEIARVGRVDAGNGVEVSAAGYERAQDGEPAWLGG